MKKSIVLSLCLIFVLSLVSLAACGKNNIDIETEAQMKAKVDTAMNAINLDVNITENVSLKTTHGDVAITWASDKAAVVSNTGTVVRPTFGQDDVEVKLTGSFSYKDYSDTKVYTVSVKSIKEKVFTFANGHTGTDAVFTAPSDLSFGSIEDKGEGVITLKPDPEAETVKNGPYFKIAEHMPTFKGNGFTAEVMVYLDREEMADDAKSFVIDFSLDKAENQALGSLALNFSADQANVHIFHTHTEDAVEDKFSTPTGWYIVGVKYHEKNGKLNAKVYINDIMDVEQHSWTVEKFIDFDITDSTGEHEDIAITQVAAPRYISFSEMNINGVDVKKVTLKYN